nr:amidase family protein [Paenibacillus donghaensis]
MDNRYGAYIVPGLRAEGMDRGGLTGLSFAVKDVMAVAGHRSSAGNPDWLRSHPPAGQHAAAVSKLLRAGASLHGATHTDELMYSLGGENHHYGTPLNPRAGGRIPGGSSSGSAVAVASGSVDFALGTDTGGSVRVPSAYCGVYGFRPTHGAVEMEGVIPLAPGFDTVGWMADSAELLERVGGVLLESVGEALLGDVGEVVQEDSVAAVGQTTATVIEDEACDAAKRVLVQPSSMPKLHLVTEGWQLIEAETAAALAVGLSRLQAGAAATAETAIAPEGLKVWMDTFRQLQGAEIWATHGAWVAKEQPAFGPDIAARFLWAAGLSGQDHSAARQLRSAIAARLRLLLADGSCLVVPTVPGPAPLRGGDLQQLEQNRSGAMMLSCIAGLAGLPQVTLPVTAKGSGLPLGLSVIGGCGQDLRLLSWISRVWS